MIRSAKHLTGGCVRLTDTADKTTKTVDEDGKIVGRLQNKVAVVTGSTAGIGLAIARRLAEEGAKVVVSSRKQGNVDKAVDELRAQGHVVHGVPCNIGNFNEVALLMQKAVDVFGQLDIVVANASTSIMIKPMLEATEKDWNKVLNVNIKGTFETLREGMKQIKATSGYGSMIVITSVVIYLPVPEVGIYCATKAAQANMVMNLARVMAPYGIRVNCVAPGMINTKMSTELRKEGMTWHGMKSTFALRRVGQPQEVAGAVVFLASEDASYISGETIVVGGGIPGRL